MIAILDYGAGNLRSVENTLDEVGAAYRLARDTGGLRGASKIILPGVGHFGQMMRALDRMQAREPLSAAIRKGVPFLGICLGLHALFESSEEAPDARGLGLFGGAVRRFPAGARVPHMGWNELATAPDSRLLRGMQASVYFAHSYYVPALPEAAATCEYSVRFMAALESGNTFGVQFHPEKSGPAGLRIMRNFAEL